jgi:hypothetical protein
MLGFPLHFPFTAWSSGLRYRFASNGDITPPCGTPILFGRILVFPVLLSYSDIGARSHDFISFSMLPSLTRLATCFINPACGIVWLVDA